MIKFSDVLYEISKMFAFFWDNPRKRKKINHIQELDFISIDRCGFKIDEPNGARGRR